MATSTIAAKSVKTKTSPATISFGSTSKGIDRCRIRATRTVKGNNAARLVINSPFRDRNTDVEVLLPRETALRLIEELAAALNTGN
jgi:hypothetical protein